MVLLDYCKMHLIIATAHRQKVIGMNGQMCIQAHSANTHKANLQLGFIVFPGLVKGFFQVLEKNGKMVMSQVQ